MEDYRSFCNLLKRNMYMGKVDLQDEYLLVPIHQNSRKYLRFIFDDPRYEYTALPFGLSSAPRVFTKIVKPILAVLRAQGHELIAFLDDFGVVA
ncbi:unnamed protein product, partial [Allacma fusca]